MAGLKVSVTPQNPTVVKVKPGAGSGIDDYARAVANAAFLHANQVPQFAFTTVNVTGQPQVIADANTDTLTFIAGTGIYLETDAANDTVMIVATGGSAFDQSARDSANSAVRTAFISVNANGTLLLSSSNTDILQLRGVSANGILITGNTDTDTVTFELQQTGVTPASYGNTTTIPSFVVDVFGRIISASNTTPSFNVAVLTSGVLDFFRGGTGYSSYTNNQILIGNTASGGLDRLTFSVGPGLLLTRTNTTINISSTLVLPVQSRSLSYAYPLVNESVTLLYTNTAITLQEVRTVVAGPTPNMAVRLYHTTDRSNANGTTILQNLLCNNTTVGISTTSFSSANVPANSFIILKTSAIYSPIEELALTMFFSNAP